jgi:hypothetical protein
MSVTILIKRNSDKNYDRLFAVVEQGNLLGRAASLSERETPDGYAVVLPYLNDATRELVEAKPKDFEIV